MVLSLFFLEVNAVDELLVHFRLSGDEARALRELSHSELRDPRDQVRFILRRELAARGLLNEDAQ